MTNPSIRDACIADAPSINRIYNHYVRTSAVTFDTEDKSVEEREAWIVAHGDAHPVLVADTDAGVIGWAALSPWSPRQAWSRTAEVAVYLDQEVTGKGLGAVLLAALIERARSCGYHSLVAQIVGGNEASLRLAEKAGFRRVGTLREVGWKFDRWLDVVLLELLLEDN